MSFAWSPVKLLLIIQLVAGGAVIQSYAHSRDNIDTSNTVTTESTKARSTLDFTILFAEESVEDEKGENEKSPATEEREDFSYTGDNGPNNWHKDYSTCVGKLQSPIDLQKETATLKSFPPLQFKNYDKLPSSMKLINNGHTVEVHLNSSEGIPSVESGPLDSVYNFAQFHFHWGANDSVGSEDTIDSKRYPMEMHMVHYKAEYGNISEAMKHEDGLMVLAVFFEVNDDACRPLAEISHALEKVTLQSSSVELTEPFPLMDLLSPNNDTYFTYRGSLTTPPCYEVVTWIDFTEPQKITEDELEQFRHVHTRTGILLNNFRPTQSLENRTVYYVSKE